MQFSEVMAALRPQGGEWTAPAPDDWLQGRSLFGGLQAALIVRAMQSALASRLPLRTLQVTFMAPVPAGDLRIRARVLRTGKSATHVEGRITAGDETLCHAVGVFGAARESVVRVAPRRPVVESAAPMPFRFVRGITPNFTQYFDARWLRGGLPFTGTPVPEAVIEVDMRDTAATATLEHLIAIADFLPPVALSMLRTPAPGSTMTWMVEFPSLPLERQPVTGWRTDALLVAAGEGYTSQSVMVWAPDGALAAVSRQSMVVFG